MPSSERRLTIDSAHQVLATSPMAPDLGIAALRLVVATYSEVLAAEPAEAPLVPLAGLLAAAQSDLGSMERRDSAALRSAVQQYTAVAAVSAASPGERRAALLRVRRPRGAPSALTFQGAKGGFATGAEVATVAGYAGAGGVVTRSDCCVYVLCIGACVLESFVLDRGGGVCVCVCVCMCVQH